MLEKITWKATVEDDSELSLDDIKVLAGAINILVDEHNKLVDIINQSSSNNALGGMLGALAGGFTSKPIPHSHKRKEDSQTEKADSKEESTK